MSMCFFLTMKCDAYKVLEKYYPDDFLSQYSSDLSEVVSLGSPETTRQPKICSASVIYTFPVRTKNKILGAFEIICYNNRESILNYRGKHPRYSTEPCISLLCVNGGAAITRTDSWSEIDFLHVIKRREQLGSFSSVVFPIPPKHVDELPRAA